MKVFRPGDDSNLFPDPVELVIPPDMEKALQWVADPLEQVQHVMEDWAMLVTVARQERDALAAALTGLVKAVDGNSTWAVDDLAQDAAQTALENHQENAKDRPAPYLKDADA